MNTIDLEQFRRNADSNDMCKEYIAAWDKCISKKDYVEMALGVKAIDFMCDAIAKGWGLSSDYIAEKFKSYINGRYVSDSRGYTSTMYCKYSGDIVCKTTLLCLIDCDVTVEVIKDCICEIYATGNTKINLIGGGRTAVIAYGDADRVIINADKETQLKRIQKANKDENK